MDKTCVMINGLPGNVTKSIATHALLDDRFELIPYSLTGQEITDNTCLIGTTLQVELVRPDIRDEKIKEIKEQFPEFISVDYTHPTAVNANARFYIENSLPFVMGTTGGDRQALENEVKKGQTPAVIAPNMVKQIVGIQAMLEYGAKTFPEMFKGYDMKVVESHQAGKADTSGTAKAMVAYFNGLGAEFDTRQIEMVRDPDVQEKEWKIPKEFISGHGWHTYTLTAPDGSAVFELKHNINGRDVYAPGTFDAVLFLKHTLVQNSEKKLFTMIDVLKRTR